MTGKQITKLVSKFPKGEQDKAAERIQWALKMGWECIDVWDNAGDTSSQPHGSDLVGQSPTGYFGFLPELPGD